MASALKRGDPITVALRAGGLCRTEVFDVPSFVSFHGSLWNPAKGFSAAVDDRGEHRVDDEGITWVRGHVADDSPEGKALLAAHTLAPKFDIALVFTASVVLTTATTFWPKGAPNPTLRIGKNPKNELGE